MQIQKSDKGIEYINVKLLFPWMGRKPVYADKDEKFSMGLEFQEVLNGGRFSPGLEQQFAEAKVALPEKRWIRVRPDRWEMYDEDESIKYRLRIKDGEIMVFDTVTDLGKTQVIPVSRLKAEQLIRRGQAVEHKEKKKRTGAPSNKRATAANAK